MWFRYAPEAPWTLDRRSTPRSRAGTRTALVGETGSGKTTLAYLVARLYEPERGCVSIDGVDIRDMTLASLAATVGLVSQETYLFHASIRENLRFACPEASDEEIEDAARAAQIHELIASLPEGYDTPVGERGYRFSGGEKQRIAIARTVLRNPPVLILDEATSALDTETERAVQQALDELARGRTTIAIAHRLSTIRDADQILVLDAGRIVERGTHEELLEHGRPLRGAAERCGRRRGSARARRGAGLGGARPRSRATRRSSRSSVAARPSRRCSDARSPPPPARPARHHRVHERLPQRLGQMLDVRAETIVGEELARVLGLAAAPVPASTRPSRSRRPAAARWCPRGSGVIPRRLPVAEVLRVGLAFQDAPRPVRAAP